MNRVRPNFVDWEKNPTLLQTKISEILKPIIKDSTHVNIIFGPDAMNKYWKKVFTHESADESASQKENYEWFEVMGDKTMEYCYMLYFRKLLGDENLDESAMTYIKREFVSKEFQALIAKNLGLDNYIRLGDYVELNESIREDILEAFFGALGALCDDMIGFGVGFSYAFNLFAHLYNQYAIDTSKIRKDDKSVLKELFEAKFNTKDVQYMTIQSDRPDLGSFRSEVFRPDGSSLGVGYGNMKKESELRASTAALEKLKQLGITPESAREEKKKKMLEFTPELAKQRERAKQAILFLNQQAMAQGRVLIYDFMEKKVSAENPKVKGPYFTYSLEVAYRQPDGSLSWRSIESESGPDPNNVKIKLFEKFADNLNIPK